MDSKNDNRLEKPGQPVLEHSQPPVDGGLDRCREYAVHLSGGLPTEAALRQCEKCEGHQRSADLRALLVGVEHLLLENVVGQHRLDFADTVFGEVRLTGFCHHSLNRKSSDLSRTQSFKRQKTSAWAKSFLRMK